MESTTAYLVVSADNINADISVSEPFLDRGKASAFLQAQYSDLLKELFGDKEMNSDDQASCTEDGYTLHHLASNDFFYGQVKEITIPAHGDVTGHGYLYLLTCKHTHDYGTDVITSLHYSKKAAEHHAKDVADSHDFEPDECETFDHEVVDYLIDVSKLKNRKE